MSQDITRIPVSKSTREKLKELGSKGETYDDIISDLVDQRVETGEE